MLTLSSLVAVVSLFLSVALFPVIGAAIFMAIFFALFLLALVGIFSGLGDRTVRQRAPSMNPTAWRDGS